MQFETMSREAVDNAFRSIWSTCMPGYSYSPNATLLEAGVDSLKAMELFFRLEGATGRKIGFSEIGVTTTIADIVGLLSNEEGKPAHRARRDVRCFIVPGIFGEELSFLKFIEEVSDTVPSKSVELPEIDAPCELQTDVNRMAEHLLDQISASAVPGSFSLAGNSFGAIVAHDMARRLEEKGMPVRSLILIDPLLFPSRSELFKRTAVRFMRTSGGRGRPSGQRAMSLANRVGQALATLRFLVLMSIGAFGAARNQITSAHATRDPEWIVQRTREYLAITRGRAVQLWSARACNSPTTIITSSDFSAQSSLMRWRSLCPDLSFEHIEAGHFDVFDPEHSHELKTLFLRAVQRRGRGGTN